MIIYFNISALNIARSVLAYSRTFFFKNLCTVKSAKTVKTVKILQTVKTVQMLCTVKKLCVVFESGLYLRCVLSVLSGGTAITFPEFPVKITAVVVTDMGNDMFNGQSRVFQQIRGLL